jgi:methyl-accepting chemotaxis protein
MFKNMKIGMRLGLGYGLVLFLLLAIAFIAIIRLSGFNQDMDTLSNDRYPKTAAANEIAFRVMDNARIIRNLILLTDEGAKASNKDANAKNIARISELFDQLGKTIKSDKGKELLNAMHEARVAYRNYTAEVIRLGLANNAEEATKVLYGENYKTQAAYFDTIKKLVEYQDKLVEDSAKQAAEDYVSTRALILALAFAAFLLGTAIAFLVTRSIIRQLGGEPAYAAEVTQRISQGDLAVSVQIQPGDNSSLLACMRTMQEQLRDMVQLVLTNAGQLTEAAGHLASSAQQVSVSSQNQSEAAASMASAVEELTVSFDQVSNNASEAQTIAKHAGELSVQGGTVVHSAVAEMNKIAESVNQSAQLIQTLGEHSGKISAIVSVIKDIADQTNLLALNAAIEAARAGEQGRGFAVVADEVRKLAERTTQSTQEISGMIDTIQSGTQNAIASMEEGSNRVKDGVEMANRAGDSMSQISQGANQVVSEVNDITASLREQTTTSNQVAMNVEKIAQMTEENSAAVGEIASAAQHLEGLAGQLQGAVSRFKV